jgi:hypothetical protein
MSSCLHKQLDITELWVVSEKFFSDTTELCFSIDYHPGAGYALGNGSDLPPGHEHPGWSRLQAQFCFVRDMAKVWRLPVAADISSSLLIFHQRD